MAKEKKRQLHKTNATAVIYLAAAQQSNYYLPMPQRKVIETALEQHKEDDKYLMRVVNAHHQLFKTKIGHSFTSCNTKGFFQEGPEHAARISNAILKNHDHAEELATVLTGCSLSSFTPNWFANGDSSQKSPHYRSRIKVLNNTILARFEKAPLVAPLILQSRENIEGDHLEEMIEAVLALDPSKYEVAMQGLQNCAKGDEVRMLEHIRTHTTEITQQQLSAGERPWESEDLQGPGQSSLFARRPSNVGLISAQTVKSDAEPTEKSCCVIL